MNLILSYRKLHALYGSQAVAVDAISPKVKNLILMKYHS